MNNYRDGSFVDIELPFADENGIAVTPISASYRILAEDNTELVASTVVTLSGSEVSVVITVSALVNTLEANAHRALRTVELTMGTAKGMVSSFIRYTIESNTTVKVGANSFQTFNQSLLLSMDMMNLDQWGASEDRDKKKSLIEAYLNVSKLSFKAVPRESSTSSNATPGLSRLSFSDNFSVSDLDETELKNLNAKLYMALRKAQIAEANYLLGGDAIGDRRSMGLMSETIGETSSMFRPGNPLNLPVSKKALSYLVGHITWSGKLGRG